MNPSDAVTLAYDHLTANDLGDWIVNLGKTKNIFGRCYHRQHVIELSEPLVKVNEKDQVEQVILHEIAHAIAGTEAGHGRKWKRIALSLGVRNPKCTTESTVKRVPFKWTGTCSKGHEYGRHRLNRNIRYARCPKDGGALDWKENK